MPQRAAAVCLAVTFVTAALGAVTGDLEVLVLDANESPLPAATVTAESPALIGRRTVTTGKRGIARLHALPPGRYCLTVGDLVDDGIEIRPDRTAFAIVRVGPALVEQVEVRERPPRLDPSSTSLAHDLPRELMGAVPLSFEYWDALDVVPGVVRDGRHPWVHGATGRDNLYLIDGVNTTDPVNGLHGTALDYETVDRHEVTTGGHMAEYGGVVGLVSNVITRSGGNDWSGGVYVYRTDADWGEDFDPDAIASSRSTAYTASGTLGGPILRDRLWHFVSFQKARYERETLVADDAAPRPDRIDDSERVFAKLTWQIAPAHRMQLAVHEYDIDYANLNSEVPSYAPDQFAKLNQPARFATLRYTGHPTNDFTLEAQVSRFERDRDLEPQFPEAGPNHSVLWVSGQFGRNANEQHHRRDRGELRIDANWFVPKGIGEHDVKLGIQALRSDNRAYSMSSGGERYWDRSRAGSSMWSIYGPGTSLLLRLQGLAEHNADWQCRLAGIPCDQAVDPWTVTDPADWQLTIDGVAYDPTVLTFDEPSSHADAAAIGWTRYGRDLHDDPGPVGAVGQDLVALYAQDDWALGRVTLRLGLRVERQRFRDSLGRERIEFDTTLAPRLGVAVDPRGDGRSKVYAHYARLYDPRRDDIASSVGQLGTVAWRSQLWVAPAGDYVTWNAGGGVGTPNVEIAPNLRTPLTDEWLVGYARTLGANTTIEVTALHRETRNGVEGLALPSGLGDPSLYPELQSGPTLESLGFPDRNGDGRVDVDDLDSSTVYCNMPELGRRFDGVDVVLRKHLADRWQLSASYAWADFRGTQDDDATYWGIGEDPDYDPRLAHNDGKLWFPDHLLKVYGSYLFPFGLELGGGLRWSSGTHYGMRTVTPFGWHNFWNGDPARIADTLAVDRDEFATAWGIPATLADGSRNPELDEAIASAVPFDLRAGRGAYENESSYALDLRLRYGFRLGRAGLPLELFLDVINATDEQRTTARSTVLATRSGVLVDPSNIGDREIYTFGTPTASQSPRTYAIGMRVSF